MTISVEARPKFCKLCTAQLSKTLDKQWKQINLQLKKIRGAHASVDVMVLNK